jgi:YVTN family beta-propeller protein
MAGLRRLDRAGRVRSAAYSCGFIVVVAAWAFWAPVSTGGEEGMTRSFFTGLVSSLAIVLGSTPSLAQNAYITNSADSTVSVIAAAVSAVVATISAGTNPRGVAVTPDGRKVYGANIADNTVSVIATANNRVSTIAVGNGPAAYGLFIQPDRKD